jgi:hypothetical protein
VVGQYREKGAERHSSGEFSQGALQWAVLESTVQKPYVLYPAALGVLGTAGAILLGPSLLFVVPAIVGGVVGLGSWAFDYFLRREHHANAYLEQLHRALAGRRAQAMQTLASDLRAVDSAQASSQLARLEDKFRAFREILGKKLDRRELTYGRYLGMVEQVFLSGLDNLQRIAHTLGSVRAIDDAYVARRIRDLEGLTEPSSVQRRELESLCERRELKRRQLEKVEEWLAENERAMTQIDVTMAAIAEMKTVHGHASTDMETAMKELQELARRAPRYSLSDE